MSKKLLVRLNPKKIFATLIYVFLICALIVYLLPILNSDEFRNFIAGLGYAGPLVIITVTAITHILLPVISTPIAPVSFGLYGVGWTMIYLYLGSLISAAVNFWIGKKYGRDVVVKAIKEDNMELVDNFIAKSGYKLLILSRLLGFAIFEIISYAAGLSKLEFKRYFLITAVFGLIPNIIFIFIAGDLDIWTIKNLVIGTVLLFLVSLISGYFIKKLILNNKEN